MQCFVPPCVATRANHKNAATKIQQKQTKNQKQKNGENIFPVEKKACFGNSNLIQS